jgi:CheY-like chemotaxis protein
MSTKVLVFESDPAFAGELRNELGKLGCATTVVDDGNAGLLQASSERPDLILLSIELPRMNGFSVCNKLKKDPNLKDVPLIIMSSESSNETFEQHKKLRTRAEDYVHKPIAFGELLQHIQGFVALGVPPSSEGEASAIVIDDEIEIGSTDYVLEDDAPQASASVRPPPSSQSAVGGSGRGADPIDADVDAFAESAFGRLTGPDAPSPPAEVRAAPSNPSNGHGHAEAIGPGPRRILTGPMPVSAPSVARPPTTVAIADYDRLRDELLRTRERSGSLEGDLRAARDEVDKLRLEVGETERLATEVDELRAKLAAGAKAGGISSREFLDLREALNRKDKEILALKEQLARRDRENIELQDKQLGFERSKADLDERLLGLERELAETRESSENLTIERDVAKKAGDDARVRLERARADAEAKDRQIAEARSRHADELASRDARLATVRSELDQVLANERAEHARAVDQAEQRRRADLEQARRDWEAAVAEARELAQREGQEALASARREADDSLAEVKRREQAALDGLRAEHEEKTRSLENDRDARLAAVEARASRELGEAHDRAAQLETNLSSTRGELDSLHEAMAAEQAEVAAKIAELERRLTEAQTARDDFGTRLAATTERAVTLEAELAGVSRELGDTKEKLTSETARAEKAHAKWEADRQSLERAKDAMAVALSQIEEAEGRPI